jgi:nucleotide-binding universal stress UspA family protein
MKILLAVDGSQESNFAIAEMARRPWPKGTMIRVLSVVENIPVGLLGLPAAYFGDLTGSVRLAAQTAVDAAVKKLIEAFGEAVGVYGDVLNGSPKRVIVEQADRWRADLIVLGSHGHGTWETLLLGPVPQSVVLHANCSVEVVRERKP